MCRVCYALFFRRVWKILNLSSILLLLYVIFIVLLPMHFKKYEIRVNVTKISKTTTINKHVETTKPIKIKYILLWTSPTESPFVYFGSGSQIFQDKKCRWTNCYATSDRNYLGHYSEFEVVLFNGPRLNDLLTNLDVPKKRSRFQKYVYANIESSANYPVNTNAWNGFFNWTWTYRLDSDSRWGYLAIRNATNHVIGPKTNMHWLSSYEMDPVSEDLKEKLKTKSRAAAWFSSNCVTLSGREDLAHKIDIELREFGLHLDVYGTCGKLECPADLTDQCLQLLEKHYYFYFAFENALSEDYVTEKIVTALNHNTVPVVYGGANYTRFMPNGIYLDALKLSPKQLAHKMNEIIKTPQLYYSFFKWKKHYSYHLRHESPETDDYCQFCAMMNDEKAMRTFSVYDKFDTWWTTNITTPDFSRVM